jgi:DNA repair protein RecO (recombination protein O)
MIYIKDEAIVLQTVLVGDKDLSLTVYLKNLGKENIYIKGGQVIKHPFLPAVQQFNWFKGVLIKYKDKLFIKEIDKSYNLAIKISKSVDSYLTAYKILEIFNKYTIFPDEKAFNLLKKTFYFLPYAKNKELFFSAFLIKYIYIHGIFPSINRCINCKTKINKQNFSCFLIKNKGVLCKKCYNRKKTDLTYEEILFIYKVFKLKFSKLTKVKKSLKNLHLINKKLIEYLRLNLS